MLLSTLRDLQHRAVRFLVVSSLSALVLSLLFVMTGLVEQFNREPFDAVNAIGGTHWILPQGVPSPITATAAIPASTVALVDAAGTASPVVVARANLAHGQRDEEVVLVGREVGGMGISPPVSGRAAVRAGEVVLDTSAGVAVGTSVMVGDRPFTVVGLIEDATLLAGIPLAFVQLADAQQVVFGGEDVVSAILSDQARPRSLPDGLHLVSADAIAQDALGPLEGAVSTIDLVRALLWVIAAVIIGGVMYLSALERGRDHAVMRAMGAPTATLAVGLAIQAAFVGLLGALGGAALQSVIAPSFPLRVRVPPDAFWQVPVAAVCVAVAASIAGMWRVVRTDPARAFAEQG